MAASTLGKARLRGSISCLVLLIALVGCDSNKQPDPRFTAGRQSLMSGHYKSAIEKLQGYLKEKPDGGLASRASFLIAKAQLGLGDNNAAREQFERTIRKYGDSEEAHKSRYKLAMLSLIEGDHADARKRFKALVEKPSGTLAPEATAMLRFLDKQHAAGPAANVPRPEGAR